MTEKKKLALMRKRNDELSKRVNELIGQLESANATKENYTEYSKELEKIKLEFDSAIKDIHQKQEEYTTLITQTKELKRKIYNSGSKVKIPLFTKIRLFIIMHKK